jgi:hypothetical protein
LYAKYSTRLTAAPTLLRQPSYLAQEAEILEDYGSGMEEDLIAAQTSFNSSLRHLF